MENILRYFVMVCFKTVLDSSWRCLYSCINTAFSFSPNSKVVSWQHNLVYQKVRLLALIGCSSGLLSCSSCQNSMSGHSLESELYPSSTGIIPTQTWAALLALTDILHALTCEWLPGEIVCGNCEQHCIYWGIRYWQLGKWCPYLGANVQVSATMWSWTWKLFAPSIHTCSSMW